MGNKNTGKIGALLGGLIVFVVPVIAVVALFHTKKPEVYTLPVIQDHTLSQYEFETTFSNTFQLDEYSEDVKFVFKTNAKTYSANKELLTPLLEETQTYARKTFKDPYPYVLFISILEDEKELIPSENLQEMYWFVIEAENINDLYVTEDLHENEIHLLDSNNRLRARYVLSKENLPQIKKDLQNLLAETYHTNSKANRKDKF